MRNLVYAINFTLDGCVDHTKQSANEEILDFYTNLLRDVDVTVYGRKTYELMVPYWPDIARSQSETRAENEFARAFDSVPRIVFSRSLDHVEDKNTRLARTDVRDEILKLKKEPGKDILVGGVDFPSQLIALGLVDEYRFTIGPTMVGAGRRLLDGISPPDKLQLKLVDSKAYQSGFVALHYLKG